MRFLMRTLVVSALLVGSANAGDGGFRYRGTDLSVGGAWMVAEVDRGFQQFEPGEVAWDLSPFAAVTWRFGWPAFVIEGDTFSAPLLAYPVVGTDTEGTIPAYLVAGAGLSAIIGPFTIGPYFAAGLGAPVWFEPYYGVGAKVGLGFGSCGPASKWGVTFRWSVRDDTGIAHDVALAIRYRFESAALHAERACN